MFDKFHGHGICRRTKKLGMANSKISSSIPNFPLISVIIPIYNGEQWISEAFASLQAQTYPNMEIIVVDDGSTDQSKTIIHTYPNVKYFYQQNKGPASARNLGLKHSKGKYIAFLDIDDLYPKDKLLKQYKALQNDTTCLGVRGLVQWVEMGTHQHVMNQVYYDKESKTSFNVNLGAFLLKKTVFELIGNLDESLIFHEDTDFWNRLKLANVLIKDLTEIGLIYRIHKQNMTHDKKAFGKGMIRAFMKKKALLAKKEEGPLSEIRIVNNRRKIIRQPI